MNKFYEYIKAYENLIDREMEAKYWTRPAKSVKITEGQEDIKHTTYMYTQTAAGVNTEYEPE